MVEGKTEGKICPRCKVSMLHKDEVMNALSRRDNETYICEGCGQQEAMIDYASSKKPKVERDNMILKDCIWLLPYCCEERAVDILSDEQKVWIEKGGDTQLVDEEEKPVVIIKRVSYSSDKTPVDMRDYKIQGRPDSPAGTIKEWKKWVIEKDYELVIIPDKKTLKEGVTK